VISVGPMRDADPKRLPPFPTASSARGGCACIPPRAMFAATRCFALNQSNIRALGCASLV
jgi:hypothetical protein